MLTGLQALRFFAAASIVVFHGIHYALEAGVIPRRPFETAPHVLSDGVVVFFVLSGFLMAMLSGTARPTRFLLQRGLRIYPAYLAAIGLTIAAKRIVLGIPAEAVPLSVLALMPAGIQPYPLGVEWTLVYEIFFYAVIALYCALPRNASRLVAIAAWLAAIVLANSLSTRTRVFTAMTPTIGQIPLSYFNVAFIAGFAAWWVRDAAEGRSGPLLAIGALAFAASETAGLSWVQSYLASVAGAMCFVLACSTTGATRVFRRDSWLVAFGNGSYGIYLLHVPVITISYALWSPRGFVACIGVTAAALVAGASFGIGEYRVHRRVVAHIDWRGDEARRTVPGSSRPAGDPSGARQAME
jgi:peptidoglycan/LPS O-acetylase OafA/YrhL